MPQHVPIDRILLHLSENRRVPIDPGKIYLLEADGDDTLIRTHSSFERKNRHPALLWVSLFVSLFVLWVSLFVPFRPLFVLIPPLASLGAHPMSRI